MASRYQLRRPVSVVISRDSDVQDSGGGYVDGSTVIASTTADIVPPAVRSSKREDKDPATATQTLRIFIFTDAAAAAALPSDTLTVATGSETGVWTVEEIQNLMTFNTTVQMLAYRVN